MLSFESTQISAWCGPDEYGSGVIGLKFFAANNEFVQLAFIGDLPKGATEITWQLLTLQAVQYNVRISLVSFKCSGIEACIEDSGNLWKLPGVRDPKPATTIEELSLRAWMRREHSGEIRFVLAHFPAGKIPAVVVGSDRHKLLYSNVVKQLNRGDHLGRFDYEKTIMQVGP